MGLSPHASRPTLREREVGGADRSLLGVLQDDHAGSCGFGAEVDVNIGTDLGNVAIEVTETAKRGPISRNPDLVEPLLEIGNRVGAVETRKFEPVGSFAAYEQVVALAPVQNIVAVTAVEDELHGR